METNKNSIETPQAPGPHQPNRAPNVFVKLRGRKLLWIAIAVAVFMLLLIAGGVFALLRNSAPKSTTTDQQTNATNPSTQSSSKPKDSLFLQQFGQNCKDRDVAFTSAPMKLEDLSHIRPLGAVSDSHVTPTDHVYIGGPNPQAADNTYPVLMPADGTITNVAAMPAQYIGDRSEQKVASEDHHITISHSCRYFSIYIHIHKLSDALKSQVGTLQPNENKKVSIDLKAGDIIGYIGNSTFDWIPIDTETTLKGFITPDLYKGESWKIHTVSPFDLYTGTLKTQLEAKSFRTTPPIGGRIDYDQPGKLIGNWFREGTGGYTGSADASGGGRYWDGHLSVVPDYIAPTYTIVSIGNWTGAAKQLLVSGSVDPSNISEQNGIIKYELKRLNYVSDSNPASGSGSSLVKDLHPSQSESVEGTILLQVLPGEKLKVEKFPGKTAAQVSGFTSAAQTYER